MKDEKVIQNLGGSTSPRDTHCAPARTLLEQALYSAVMIAIARNNIEFEAGTVTPEEAARDAALACFGQGTCNDEPIPEVAELLLRLAGSPFSGEHNYPKLLPGSRVRLSSIGLREKWWPFHSVTVPERCVGTVIRIARTGRVYVVWDGWRTPQPYDADATKALELIPPIEARAAAATPQPVSSDVEPLDVPGGEK